MAVLTLRKIKHNLNFSQSSQVKITHNSVKATILTTTLTARSDLLLSLLFNQVSKELKTPDWQYSPSSISDAVSRRFAAASTAKYNLQTQIESESPLDNRPSPRRRVM
jgi:hypothetical protein